MIKFIKYLKGHTIPILIIFVLLIIQAICELALPAYTANIVDTGIQQGGIENGVPKVIRSNQLDQLKTFMSEEEVEGVDRAYRIIDKNNISAEKWDNYVKDYPIIESEQIFELIETKESTINELNIILNKPMIIATMISSSTDVETGMEGQLEEFPDSIKEQMAVAYVKAEYEAIGIDMGRIQNSYITFAGVRMIGVALLAVLITILVGLIASRVAAKIGMGLRTGVFSKVVFFSNNELDKFSTASLITRSTNDIQQIQMAMVLMLRMALFAPILGIGGIIKVLETNTSMAWIILVGVLAIVCLVVVLFTVAMPKFKKMQTLVDKVNLVTREILTGLPVIRAFSTQKHEEKRFDKANVDLTGTMLFTNRAMAFMMPVMMLIMNGITVMIIWFGAKGIDLGDLQVGEMMAFITYTVQIVMSFFMLSMISIMLPRAAVSAKRVNEILETNLSIQNPDKAKVSDGTTKGIIEFDHVSFHYSNAEENVLENITFTARPGETTAFIGSTGSGKSTLINLIPRFYDVTEGSIRIDGVDIRDMTGKDLRAQLGYVPQKGVLFSGTIDSNLRYGKENATEAEITKAVRIAQAKQFIEENEKGYDSEISQDGSNVSGGQKQRLSIARAIVKKPQIYIFDDSFSALDYKTDIALRKALKEETSNSTVLIVAQRVSTILEAEQIIVLDEGKIVGMGNHRELMKNNQVYQQIAMSQLSLKELEGEDNHE